MLTCSVFVTDQTHQQELERQLADTAALIERASAGFAQRHGRPVPADNVWLAQRQAEHAALTRVLAAMQAAPGRAVQGAGCGAAPAGPSRGGYPGLLPIRMLVSVSVGE